MYYTRLPEVAAGGRFASFSQFSSRIERDEVKVRTADTVIFETVFTLQRVHRQKEAAIGGALLPLLELPGIMLPGKRPLSPGL
jgi:hypothetical protein